MDCHGGGLAEARIDLEAMTEAPDFGRGFKDWEKVVRMVRERKMPPKDDAATERRPSGRRSSRPSKPGSDDSSRNTRATPDRSRSGG